MGQRVKVSGCRASLRGSTGRIITVAGGWLGVTWWLMEVGGDRENVGWFDMRSSYSVAAFPPFLSIPSFPPFSLVFFFYIPFQARPGRRGVVPLAFGIANLND